MKNHGKTITKAAAACFALVLAVSLAPSVLAGGTVSVWYTSGENSVPVAENIEVTTYRDIAVSGTFSAVDPDGDPVSFSVSDYPSKGEVTVGDGGSFTYSPASGKKGRDTFSYVAVDEKGNVSEPGVVTIRIEKQAEDISYSDMYGNAAHYAALRLADEGIYTGRRAGNEYLFEPEEAVSRGEFLALCLDIAGEEGLSGISRTGFDDDESIPMWMKPYVSAALLSGVISGYVDNCGNIVFSAESDVTFAQASVILNNVLGISDVNSASVVDASAVPAWAYQAAVNLEACDIVSVGLSAQSGVPLTRSEAALMLASAMELLEERNGGGSLLGWAK